jgi:hypothetical protein
MLEQPVMVVLVCKPNCCIAFSCFLVTNQPIVGVPAWYISQYFEKIDLVVSWSKQAGFLKMTLTAGVQ